MKFLSALILFLVSCFLLSTIYVRTGEAALTTIYIRSDGTIDPPTALISTFDNITYQFTDNVLGSNIIVQKNDTVIDGTSHTLQGDNGSSGISLYNVSNVTVMNTTIVSFNEGIDLSHALSIRVIDNSLTGNVFDGIRLQYSNNSIFSGNVIENNNSSGILCAYSSCYNQISENNITGNGAGIVFSWASNDNVIFLNNVLDNDPSVRLWISASNNKFCHNNFVTNKTQVEVSTIVLSRINVWDDGYPSGGNYWSDFNATDSNGDGIADYSYVIDADNVDNYPLVNQIIVPEFQSFLALPISMMATLAAIFVLKRRHALDTCKRT